MHRDDMVGCAIRRDCLARHLMTSHRVLAAILVVLVFSSVSAAQSPSAPTRPILTSSVPVVPPSRAERIALFGSAAAMWGAAAYDVHTTNVALDTGHYREGNPLLRANGFSPALVYGSTALTTVGTTYLYRRGHPKLAIVVNLVVCGIHVAAGIHNSRLPR